MLTEPEIEKMARKYVGGAISPKAPDPGGSAPFVVRSKNREEAPRRCGKITQHGIMHSGASLGLTPLQTSDAIRFVCVTVLAA